MAFYVAIFSMAAVAVLVAVLMHWPKLDDRPEQEGRAAKRRH